MPQKFINATSFYFFYFYFEMNVKNISYSNILLGKIDLCENFCSKEIYIFRKKTLFKVYSENKYCITLINEENYL